jgi:hypothetical protein
LVDAAPKGTPFVSGNGVAVVDDGCGKSELAGPLSESSAVNDFFFK